MKSTTQRHGRCAKRFNICTRTNVFFFFIIIPSSPFRLVLIGRCGAPAKAFSVRRKKVLIMIGNGHKTDRIIDQNEKRRGTKGKGKKAPREGTVISITIEENRMDDAPTSTQVPQLDKEEAEAGEGSDEMAAAILAMVRAETGDSSLCMLHAEPFGLDEAELSCDGTTLAACRVAPRFRFADCRFENGRLLRQAPLVGRRPSWRPTVCSYRCGAVSTAAPS